MRKIHRLNRGVSAKIVLGGPGAWQIAGDPARRQELGIDHVVAGYAEENVAATCSAADRGDEPLPEVVSGGWEPAVADSADSRRQHHGRGGDQPRMRAGLLVLHDRPRADGSSAAGDHSGRRADQRGRRPATTSPC